MKKIIGLELLKLKNSRIFLVVTLAPVFMVFQGVANFLRYYDIFTSRGQNMWYQIYLQSSVFYVSALFPALIALIMVSLARIEYVSGGLRYYLTLPVKRSYVYAAKLLVGCMLSLLNVLVFSLSLLVAGKVIGAPGEIPYDIILTRPLLVYIASLPVMIVTFLLSINFSQIGIPLGIGIGLATPSLLVANTRYWVFYPWTYPIMAALGGELFKNTYFPFVAGPLIFVILTFAGLRWFKEKDVLD